MLRLVELRRAARILGDALVAHRIQRIDQPDPESLALELYGGEGAERGRKTLRLCCAGGSARVSLVERAPRATSRVSPFVQVLRARLDGARIAGGRIVGGDRQLGIRLETRDAPFELLLAILGRRSNLVLLDGEGRIAATLRPLADTRPELSVGDVWQAPASRPPSEGEDRFADVPDAEYLTAIEAHYAAAETEHAHDALRRRIGQALAKQARTLDRKLEKLARELAEAERATACERQGELLKGALARVPRGAREVRVRDYETGEEVAIPLDPKLSPAENLEALFRRYRKALRTLTRGGAQQDAVRGDRDALAALEAEFAALSEDDTGANQAFAARPELARLLERQAPAERPRPARPGRDAEIRLAGRTVPRRLAPRRYRSEPGLEIWVGRSDEGNDFLSTRLARGNDLFFHLDGAPGSHVVLRTEGRPDPPSEAVLDACELAVHYSKAKNATRADVHVVPIKNVRKPKGAKRGLVMVHGGRTVHLRRIPARLERLLASRIED